MLTNLLVGLVIAAVVLVFLYTPGPGQRLRHRAMYRVTRSEWQAGRAVVVLRVVDGSHAGLGPRWRSGTAVATPGRLEFTRFVGGMSFLKRPVTPVQVVAAGSPGPIRGLSRLWLDPDCRVTRLTTPTAVLEIAVQPPIPAEQVLGRMR
ncbi:hypothetical protein [Actinophytocola algeriensis]|uniref:Uncharacterized protein n=1 Tax=Actinophytocola algeriensis TaxID=1768010 RepID=A0A7W7Q5T1_9PSEU|nr:hypothetical protein [Actinophytocola algeriensis]MBB4907234.1 hypothetical protein [Actinophytocola algeriensis]MBE1478717.1 hypothetical protein [Actinophytocola algeriensis]